MRLSSGTGIHITPCQSVVVGSCSLWAHSVAVFFFSEIAVISRLGGRDVVAICRLFTLMTRLRATRLLPIADDSMMSVSQLVH